MLSLYVHYPESRLRTELAHGSAIVGLPLDTGTVPDWLPEPRRRADRAMVTVAAEAYLAGVSPPPG